MFKKFLMDNAHRENVKNLFRWWNGHVFSFGMPGANRLKDDDGFDSGMDEAAEAALDSNEEFDGEGHEASGDDHNSWYVSEEHPADRPPLQMNTNSRPDDLSVDFIQLTISDHSEAPGTSNPVAAPVPAIAVPRVHEPISVRFAGASRDQYNFTQ